MDVCIEGLSNRMTAQEMIKANSLAEAEEMNNLKGQVEEYQQILNRLEEMMDAVEGKLDRNENTVENLAMQEVMKESSDAVRTEMKASNESMRLEIQNSNEVLKEALRAINHSLREEVKGEIAILSERLNGSVGDVASVKTEMESVRTELVSARTEMESVRTELVSMKTEMESVKENIEATRNCVENKEVNLGENGMVLSDENDIMQKLKMLEAGVHRECVKVYRNVQAVVVDENNKQTDEHSYTFNAMKKKLGLIFPISVGAFVFSMVSVIVQLLIYFKII